MVVGSAIRNYHPTLALWSAALASCIGSLFSRGIYNIPDQSVEHVTAFGDSTLRQIQHEPFDQPFNRHAGFNLADPDNSAGIQFVVPARQTESRVFRIVGRQKAGNCIDYPAMLLREPIAHRQLYVFGALIVSHCW